MPMRTVFITGASSGIGKAMAIEYAKRGAHVALAARRTDLLEETSRTMAEAGGRALVMALDVRNKDDVFDAVRRAERELGSLDVVIANAGYGKSRHSSRLEWDNVMQTFDVNLHGAIATLMAAIPIMLGQKSGQLVGVSSLAGRRGLPHSAPYSASKAALSSFLDTLRIDLAAANIRVTDVQPGFVDTPMTKENRHPMPFMWPSDKAARYIVTKIEKRAARIVFPWQLDFLTRLAQWLPTWAYDRLLRTARG